MHPIKPTFPSKLHEDSLRRSAKAGLRPNELDPAMLTSEQRYQWHAYDYGWRAAVGLPPVSPIDPQSLWRDEAMIREVTAWYKDRGFNRSFG